MDMAEQKTLDKMQKFVDRFREKTGTFGYPDANITEVLVEGLAGNVEEVGRPMSPCQFYPEGEAEAAKSSEWACPCWEFQIWKYCH
jgi:ferredoxin-thioredoxin reductase catalytic chain